MKATRLGLCVSVLLACLLCGCAQKLTYERWQSIHTGDEPPVVEALLGEPVEKLDMRWLYMDPDRGISADIYFQEDRVIGKTWSDPDRGMVGQSPHVNQPGDSDTLRYRKVE